jgi:hypothetical protein
MDYNVSGNNLTFANKTNVDFEYPILKVLEVYHFLIVVLDIPDTKYYNNNVFAFNTTGDFLWHIEDVELYEKGRYCAYIDIIINKEHEVVLFNWCDTAVVINPQDGEVLRRYPTK